MSDAPLPTPDSIPSRQFWIRTPGEGEIREAPIPGHVPGHLRIRARWSGISRGTESLVFRGEVPPRLHATMRAPFQDGDFPAPVKYGYASVGQVDAAPAPEGPGAAAPAGTPSLEAGDWVFCLHPHQDLYWVPPEAVTPIPPGVPPARAVLAANMETALNATWDGRPGPGDRIVVVGAGVVGLLVAWLCARIPGTRVTAVDLNPSRASAARALGVGFATPGTLPPASADLVFHASGSPEGAAEALELAGQEATVVELSWYGTRSVPLPLGEGFHPRRLTLRSSQVGAIPPERRPRWDFARRLQVALDLLQASELDALVTHESAFDELPRVMSALARHGGDTLCHRVRYPSSPTPSPLPPIPGS